MKVYFWLHGISIEKIREDNLLSMEPWTADKKNFQLVWRCHAPVWVPSRRPLVPSVASVTSVANDNGDNEMILGAVCRSPRISLQPRKTSAKRPSYEGAVQPFITSNGVPFLQMRSVGSHSMSGRK